MRRSSDHLLTSHVGSLPRPDDLIEANRAREAGEVGNERGFRQTLGTAVADVVARQRNLGIDVPGDGEFGKPVGHRVNYGAWWNYAFNRLGGLELGGPGLDSRPPQQSRPGEIVLTSAAHRRDRVRFADAYADPESGVWMGPRPTTGPVCVGPLTYTGHAAIRADIANFKGALKAAEVEEGFMTSVAPGSAYRIPNQYYKTDEEFLYAWAEAMREEYRAILDAGLVLQLDDPATATGWDMIDPQPPVEAYKKFTMMRIEALNHALHGLPQERIRFHLCWGSWHGPHTTDIPMRDIVDVMLAVNSQAYSFEAGNVRHAHEWKVWQDVKLPDDKLILPGVVSHATNVVEHPELVAARIVRFAKLVGKERVIASTDCGLGGRVHPQIAWAKLEALVAGATLATRQLWGRGGPPMKSSSDHILTSHAGSLPRPDELIAAWGASDERALADKLTASVADVVRRQKDAGIDIPGDGEFGKPMAQRVNYGSWWRYSWNRLGGLDPNGPNLYEMAAQRSRPGHVVLTSFGDRRDRTRFAAAYGDPDSGITTGPRPPAPVCIAPIHYAGHDAIKTDIANFKAALNAAGVEEGFMTAVAPGSASRIGNSYYKTEEELLYACADAMREEYKAILDAGLVLQLDDPAIAENWDMVNPEPTVEEYKKFSMVRVAALNHAIRGLPADRIRFHLCWGSWHGPHVTDIAMHDIVDVMLAIDVRAYSFEAGNVRHEHEWKIWQDVKLPDDKLILPGVVSHATNVVEHPELVAERIIRFANLVGRERVIASTDCGLGGRVHPQIAWAKLGALAEGAAAATRQLWR